MSNQKPSVLFLDVETTPNLGWCWGKYQQDIISFKKEGDLLCFAAKWLDVDGVYFYDIRDGRKKMLRELWELLDEADIVVAHNGDSFDIPKINTAFLRYGFPPPSPFKTIDTKKAAKQYFYLNSNKLNDIALLLEKDKKHPTDFGLWLGCMKNDPDAWKKMEDYNRQDIVLLEKIYLKLRPWIRNHPNYSWFTQGGIVCPKCGGVKSVSKGRVLYQGKTEKQQRRCVTCGGWFLVSLKKGKEEKPILNA